MYMREISVIGSFIINENDEAGNFITFPQRSNMTQTLAELNLAHFSFANEIDFAWIYLFISHKQV